MKTLVKYLPKSTTVSVKCTNKKDFVCLAKKLVENGCGDNTVQENGVVWVVLDQYKRLGFRA